VIIRDITTVYPLEYLSLAVNQRFSAVDTPLVGMDKRINALASDWRLSLDVHERLAKLEAGLEKR